MDYSLKELDQLCKGAWINYQASVKNSERLRLEHAEYLEEYRRKLKQEIAVLTGRSENQLLPEHLTGHFI